MSTISLVAERFQNIYKWGNLKHFPLFIPMLLIPIVSLIAGVTNLIRAGKDGGLSTQELRVNLIGGICHGFILILGLGFLLFVITNIVSVGVTIKERCSG